AVLAFEMLTGERPFNADSMPALMHQIIMVDPLTTQEARAKVPSRMVPAFSRALAKSPADRFPRCAAFVRALTEGTPAAARVAAARPAAPAAVGTSKAPLMALALGLAVAVLGGGGYWVAHRTPASGGNEAKAESPLVKAIDERRLDDARKLLAKGV